MNRRACECGEESVPVNQIRSSDSQFAAREQLLSPTPVHRIYTFPDLVQVTQPAPIMSTEREDHVTQAKMAEQAERYDGESDMSDGSVGC